MRRILPLTLLVAVLGLLPTGAEAAPYMVSVMQDDGQLAYAEPPRRRAALDRMKELGVEAVRVTILWSSVAPTRPRNGKNPRSYRPKLWDNYDDLVRAAKERGLIVYFNPTGPGAPWAHARAPKPEFRASWRPNAKAYGEFVQAAGRRYSGFYRDENGKKDILPRVYWWSLYNEPNQAGWLMPQGEVRRGTGKNAIPISPHLYRDLVVSGAKGLAASGHADDLVLIGETAPLGEQRARAPRPPLRPGLFIREMFCLDNRLRPFRGVQARARGCAKVGRLSVLGRFKRLGWGHHPYTKKLAPNKREGGRDAMTMANINALPKLLDKIAARTGLLPAEMPILLTEYGYETRPPDPFSGVSLPAQAEYLNLGDYIAWKHPRIFSNTQFLLIDVPPRTNAPRGSKPYWFTYQSGLFAAEKPHRPKPAAGAYAFPLLARRSGRSAQLWGQLRFVPNGSRHVIALQSKAPGSNRWVTAGSLVSVTHNQGYFEARRATVAGATWRAVWAEPDFSQILFSREARLR